MINREKGQNTNVSTSNNQKDSILGHNRPDITREPFSPPPDLGKMKQESSEIGYGKEVELGA